MALEGGKISRSVTVPRNGEYSSSNDPEQFWKNSNVQSTENLGDFLNDYESYWQDINDRLIISRTVSDSVVKGIVTAVSQEAAETVSAKCIELDGLKEQLLECGQGQLSCQSCLGKKMQEKLKAVSSICQDLDSVQKSLFHSEKLTSHGSLELDQFQCRVLTNHVSQSKANLPENLEFSHIKHLNIDEMYSYFRDVITELRRDHETSIQAITEDYFSLKREFLKERKLVKERGYILPLKSKDMEALRKTIPSVISKFKDILSDGEDSSKTCDFLVQNLKLRGLLDKKKVEIECLSSQVSEVEVRLAQHILDAACQSKIIEDLKKSLEDADMESSVREEVYSCIIKELLGDINRGDKENDMRSGIMQESLAIVYKEAILEAGFKMRLKCEELSNMQAINFKEVCGIIFGEVWREMDVRFENLRRVCLQQDELIVSLESERSDLEKALARETLEKDEIKQKISELEAVTNAQDTNIAKAKEQFERALNNIKDLKTQKVQDEALICQRDSEVGKLKVSLKGSLLKIDQCEDQIGKLTKMLELVQMDSKSALEDRAKSCLLLDAKDKEYRKQIESAAFAIQEMNKAFKNLELRAIESMKWNNVRVENSAFQLGLLIKKVNVLRRTGSLYKQRLERRCSDLQKAEAEVDLLGDEVETLLGLLEKIYIALDHYSPILQHYPGIMEILKLVDRKLSTEYAKSIHANPY